MWFKNLKIFQFTGQFQIAGFELEDKLEEHAFRPCGQIELSAQGWGSPAGRNEEPLIINAGADNLLICLQTEEKILPSSVINELLEDKVRQIRDDGAEFVGRKQKAELKENIIHTLLPKAFVHSKFTFGYLDLSNQRLLVNSASDSAAEAFCSHLRKTLGSLPIKPLLVATTPPSLMTDWLLKESNPADIELSPMSASYVTLPMKVPSSVVVDSHCIQKRCWSTSTAAKKCSGWRSTGTIVSSASSMRASDCADCVLAT